MAVRKITTLPGDAHVLRAPARPVTRFDATLRALLDDMADSMHGAQGVGLAAPQIGVPLRVILLGLPGRSPFPLINPEVLERGGEREMTEGCLSVPGYRGAVLRSETVRVRALDPRGREIEIAAAGDLLAHALEHEIDHINGTVYIDHVQSPDELWHLDELEPDDDEEDEEGDDARDDE